MKKLKMKYKLNPFNKYILKHYYIMFKKKYSLSKYFGKSRVKKSLRRKTFRKRHNLRKRHNKSKKNMRGGWGGAPELPNASF